VPALLKSKASLAGGKSEKKEELAPAATD